MPTTTDVNDLRTRLRAARNYGVIHLVVHDHSPAETGTDPRDAADAFVAALGFHPLGDDWAAINRVQARRIVYEILRRDLSYEQKLMEVADADACAGEFIGLFEKEARFFTNADYTHHYIFIKQNGYSIGNWVLPHWSYETGIVAVDSRKVGLIWAGDDD